MTRPVVLTLAQWRVAHCIARGLSYAETARELGCVRQTVKAHVFAIERKIPNPNNLPQKSALVVWMAEQTQASKPLANSAIAANTQYIRGMA